MAPCHLVLSHRNWIPGRLEGVQNGTVQVGQGKLPVVAEGSRQIDEKVAVI